MDRGKYKVVLFANTDWYLFNFRLSLAESLRESGADVLMISPPGSYGERLRSLGFRWQALPMKRRSLNPLREFALLFHLIRLFRGEKPAIVHGFTIKAAVYGAIAAKAAGVPAIVGSVNGLGYVFISHHLKARFLRPLVRRAMRFAFSGRKCRVIVQNPTDRDEFVGEGIVPAGSIHLIPGSGVDCNVFRPHAAERATGEQLRVLLPARLLWDKGVGEFVEASRILGQERLRFQVAGDIDPGNPAAVSAAEIEAWQSAGLVELLGHVDDMAALLPAVDIVVLPSYREGLPKSLIEAAACGRPIIATDVPGCRDVVGDGVNGLLVPVRDGEALADAIRKMADEPAMREEMGKAGRQRALQMFDKEIIVRETMEVYESVCRAGRAPAC